MCKIYMMAGGMLKGAKVRDEYLSAIEALLRKGKGSAALAVLRDAMIELPNDLLLLSYYGCLIAIVEKKASTGAKICMKAIETFGPFGEFISPVFFLNLGRSYLAGRQKKRAIRAFKQGLSIDTGNHAIIMELKKLGIRRKPPFSFLQRNNPLNKYIGILLSKLKKTEI